MAETHAVPGDAAEPEADSAPAEPATGQRRTRADRRAADTRSTPSRLPARVGRSVAVLCVLAGVVAFGVVRHQDRRDATARAAAADSSTSASTDSPQAGLTSPGDAQTFVSAAATGVVTVTESDYRRLDEALSAGESVTTGSFRTRFRQALTGTAAATRKQNHSVTSIQVLQTGIGSVTDDGKQGKVLIFARVTQTGDNVAQSDRSVLTTLCVTLQRDGNRYLISDLAQGTNAGLPPGTAGLRAAAEAARREIVALLSFDHTDPAAGLTRARGGATGAARDQVTKQATALKVRASAGGYDLSGAVTSVAVQNASGASATLLLAATGTRVAADGSTSPDTDGHYVATVQLVNGTWLLSALSSVS